MQFKNSEEYSRIGISPLYDIDDSPMPLNSVDNHNGLIPFYVVCLIVTIYFR